jgi:DNA processing protein
MERIEAWYALAGAQISARAALRLLEVFGEPEGIFAATPREWTAAARLSPAACQRLLAAVNRPTAEALARLARLGISLLGLTDPAYPPRLRAIPDPPAVLFVKGTLVAEDTRAIAIVGSRRASPYGRHVAAELAAGLAQQGFTVVSGMALGADAAAHEGALRAGGRTLAVLGSGIDVVYPAEHVDLYARIAASAAVISEYPPGLSPTRYTFPARNRIISGLSLGVVVVEAPEDSGALITAQHALEQGREVFAVPGSVNSAQSRGTHKLLRDGAKLVESVADILEDLLLELPAKRAVAPLAGPSWGPGDAEPTPAPAPAPARTPARTPKPVAPPPPPAPTPAPALPPAEAAVLALLSTTAKHVDDLIEAANLPPAQVNAALLMLELKGLIQRQPGNLYVRMG